MKKASKTRTAKKPLSLGARCRSISVGPDNGFLACAGNYFRNPPGSVNTSQCVNNLLGCLGAGQDECLVISHGNVGYFKTGGGDSGGTDDQIVGYWNRPKWSQYFRSLRNKCTGLTICACDTGAGQEGADLLFDLATLLNAPVLACTYLMWCQGTGGPVYMDPKAQWQIARPGQKPNPIPKPSLILKSIPMKFVLLRDQQKVTVPLESVRAIRVRRTNVNGKELGFAMTAIDGRALLELIDLEHPITNKGRPAAVITGQVEIDVEEGKTFYTLRFVMYNDELLQDTDNRDVFYYVTDGFARSLSYIA